MQRPSKRPTQWVGELGGAKQIPITIHLGRIEVPRYREPSHSPNTMIHGHVKDGYPCPSLRVALACQELYGVAVSDLFAGLSDSISKDTVTR